jgi:hypothetical protein
MLERARAGGVPAERLHPWRLGDPPPAGLAALAPFDAALALGNVWPMILAARELDATGAALHVLLRPGARLVLGLKAFEVRRTAGDPYLPLLKRRLGERTLWFVRFVDFEVPQPSDGVRACELHMVVVAGTAGEPQQEILLHRATRVRSWDGEELRRWLERAGFAGARVGGRLDDPEAAATGEDVFAVAQRMG